MAHTEYTQWGSGASFAIVALVAVGMLVPLLSCVWVTVHGKHVVVKSGQPLFLKLFTVSCAIFVASSLATVVRLHI